jgi:hypothetical protein
VQQAGEDLRGDAEEEAAIATVDVDHGESKDRAFDDTGRVLRVPKGEVPPIC